MKLRIGLALACALLCGPALAASTINTNVPQPNAPLQSAPIRNNFLAAASDYNAQLGMFATNNCNAISAPTVGQDCLNIGSAPATWYKWTGAGGWGQIGTINLTTGVFSVSVSPLSLLTTAPITVGFSGGVATVGITLDSNFTVTADALAFAPVAAGRLLANCSAISAAPTNCTWNSYANQAIGNTNGMLPYRSGGSWTTISTGTSGATIPRNDTGNTFGLPQSIRTEITVGATLNFLTLGNTSATDGTSAKIGYQPYTGGNQASFSFDGNGNSTLRTGMSWWVSQGSGEYKAMTLDGDGKLGINAIPGLASTSPMLTIVPQAGRTAASILIGTVGSSFANPNGDAGYSGVEVNAYIGAVGLTLGATLSPLTVRVVSSSGSDGIPTGILATSITNGTWTPGADSGPVALQGLAQSTRGLVQVASFTGSIAGNILTASALTGSLAIGQTIQGAGVTTNTVIVNGSGLSWVLNRSQTVGSVAMTASFRNNVFAGSHNVNSFLVDSSSHGANVRGNENDLACEANCWSKAGDIQVSNNGDTGTVQGFGTIYGTAETYSLSHAYQVATTGVGVGWMHGLLIVKDIDSGAAQPIMLAGTAIRVGGFTMLRGLDFTTSAFSGAGAFAAGFPGNTIIWPTGGISVGSAIDPTAGGILAASYVQVGLVGSVTGGIIAASAGGGAITLEADPTGGSNTTLKMPFIGSTDFIVTNTGVATLTNKTLTSPVISGGTIDNAVIGGTTRAAGSFTTVAANGQITSTLAIGTAPLVITSTTLVANLYVARAALADAVTTNANLTGDITSVGNATTYAGVVPIAKGGTGQITATLGFNALSPMTTAGDIIYGGASGVGTRLAAGTTSQVFISGTTPSWGTVTNAMITNATIDLTTKVTGTLPGGNGGTGSAFFAVTGPATSLKTFTFPNASATVLTDNAAVTAVQGGTGQTVYAVGDILYASTTTALSKLTPIGNSQTVLMGGTIPAWGTKIGGFDFSNGAGYSSMSDATPVTVFTFGPAGDPTTYADNTTWQWRARDHTTNLATMTATGLTLQATGAKLTVNSATMITTTTAFTNGGAASTPTLGIAGPVGATTPTKWIPIVDNGTTRYIPSW